MNDYTKNISAAVFNPGDIADLKSSIRHKLAENRKTRQTDVLFARNTTDNRNQKSNPVYFYDHPVNRFKEPSKTKKIST